MTEETQATTPDEVVNESEAPIQEAVTTETDTVEVEETDDQKNERVQREEAEKAEKKARGVQKRLDELTADKYAERKRADELAALNARLLAMMESKEKPVAVESNEPKREDFADDVQWLRAVAKYDAEQAAEQRAKALLEQRIAQEREQTVKTQQDIEAQRVAKEFIERRQAAEKSIPDYKDTIAEWEPQIPESVQEMIVRLPDGPLVSYHLAKNPQLEAQFLSQPEYMHGVLLGQLLATIKSTAKQTTQAPAAGKPVQTKAASSNEPPSDPDQYRAWADKNLR